MAQLASTLAQQISTRARDSNQTGTTQTNVLLLMSYAQQLVNGALQDVIASTALNLTARVPIYSLTSNLPSTVAIVAIRDASGRDLDPMPFETLVQIDPRWYAAVSDQPRDYALAGRDQLVIYPAPITAQTLTVYYAKLTATLSSGSTTEVPNEDDDPLQDLTELLLLLKARDMSSVMPVLQRYQQRIKSLSEEPR